VAQRRGSVKASSSEMRRERFIVRWLGNTVR